MSVLGLTLIKVFNVSTGHRVEWGLYLVVKSRDVTSWCDEYLLYIVTSLQDFLTEMLKGM